MVIGLTGGICSGKSTVLNEAKEIDSVATIDCDAISREIMKKSTSTYSKVLKEFGEWILLPNGEIDRKKLARLIFSDPAKRKKLEEITHPVIIEKMKTLIDRYRKRRDVKVIIVDIPLLFEKGLRKMVDKVLVVWVPRQLQVERLISREGISKKEALQMLSAQISLRRKLELADYKFDGRWPKRLIRKKLIEILRIGEY